MALLLFIDDDPLTLELLSQVAKIIGHEAIISLSGEEAINIASQSKPDLIIIDLNLEGANGLEVVKKLKGQAETAKIPVVILSAGTGLNSAKLAKESGAEIYLDKPIHIETLTEVIREFTAEE